MRNMPEVTAKYTCKISTIPSIPTLTTTVSPRMWVSYNTTASEAQNLLLMPRFPVCSAFLIPRLPIEIEIEIVYNMYRMNRLLSLGPPNNAFWKLASQG
jgi:hypothetical protein